MSAARLRGGIPSSRVPELWCEVGSCWVFCREIANVKSSVTTVLPPIFFGGLAQHSPKFRSLHSHTHLSLNFDRCLNSPPPPLNAKWGNTPGGGYPSSAQDIPPTPWYRAPPSDMVSPVISNPEVCAAPPGVGLRYAQNPQVSWPTLRYQPKPSGTISNPQVLCPTLRYAGQPSGTRPTLRYPPNPQAYWTTLRYPV